MKRIVLFLFLVFVVVKGDESFFQQTYKNSYLNILANLRYSNLLAIKSAENVEKKLYLLNLTSYNKLNKENNKIYTNIFLSLYLSFLKNTKAAEGFKDFEKTTRIDKSLINSIKILRDTCDTLSKYKDLPETSFKLLEDNLIFILKKIKGKKSYIYTLIRKTISLILLQKNPTKPVHFSSTFISANFKKLKENEKWLKNLSKIGDILSNITNVLNVINDVSQTTDSYEKKLLLKQYLILKGTEFLMIMKSLNDNDYYELDNFKIGFLQYLNNLQYSNLETQLQIDSYIKSLTNNMNLILDLTNYASSIFVEIKDSTIGFFVSNVYSFAKDFFDINRAKKNYNLYRDLIIGLKYSSLYDYKFGYINIEDIRKHIASNLLFLLFVDNAENYLYTLANSGADKYTSVGMDFINYYKMKKNLDSSKITNDFAQAFADSIDLILKLPANGWISGVKNLSHIITFNKFLHSINMNISQFELMLDQTYNNLSAYLHYLMMMNDNKDYFEATFQNNINIDDEFDNFAKIYSNNRLNVYNKNTVLQSYIFYELYKIPLIFQESINNLPNTMYRKDYFIMLLKAAGYNPYADSEFMKKLWTGKIEFFSDIDDKRLTLNEKIWLIYGKYLHIINGDNNKLLPFEYINRVQAMAIAGRIYKQKFNLSIPQCLLSLLPQMYQLLDYNDLNTDAFKDFKKDVDLALYSGLIIGVPIKNSDKRELQLSRNLSVSEGVLIALRLNNLINNNLVSEYTEQFYNKVLNSNIFKNDKNLKNYTRRITNNMLLKFPNIISLPNSLLKRNINVILTYDQLKDALVKYFRRKNYKIKSLLNLPDKCKLATKGDMFEMLNKIYAENYQINMFYNQIKILSFINKNNDEYLTLAAFIKNLNNIVYENIFSIKALK